MICCNALFIASSDSAHVSVRGVGLIICTLDSLYMEISESKKNFCLTPRSVSMRIVNYIVNISAKTNLSATLS